MIIGISEKEYLTYRYCVTLILKWNNKNNNVATLVDISYMIHGRSWDHYTLIKCWCDSQIWVINLTTTRRSHYNFHLIYRFSRCHLLNLVFWPNLKSIHFWWHVYFLQICVQNPMCRNINLCPAVLISNLYYFSIIFLYTNWLESVLLLTKKHLNCVQACKVQRCKW